MLETFVIYLYERGQLMKLNCLKIVDAFVTRWVRVPWLGFYYIRTHTEYNQAIFVAKADRLNAKTHFTYTFMYKNTLLH